MLNTQFSITPAGAGISGVMPRLQEKKFECGDCGDSFTSFKEAARHAWTAGLCKGKAQHFYRPPDDVRRTIVLPRYRAIIGGPQ